MESVKGAIKIKILKLGSEYKLIIKKLIGKKITDYIYRYIKKYTDLFKQIHI